MCDTEGIVGVTCVPAAAPAASAQCGTGKHTAGYCVLASGSAGNPRSWNVKANHQVLSLIFLDAFATEKFSRHLKCILYSFP